VPRQLFASVAVTFVYVRYRLATLFITYNWPWHDVTKCLLRFYSYYKNVRIMFGWMKQLNYSTTVSSVHWHVYCCSTHVPVRVIECLHRMCTRYRRLWACNNSAVGHVSSISRPHCLSPRIPIALFQHNVEPRMNFKLCEWLYITLRIGLMRSPFQRSSVNSTLFVK